MLHNNFAYVNFNRYIMQTKLLYAHLTETRYTVRNG